MVLALWLSLLSISLVVSFTPGAGAINTMSNALLVGWRRALWGVIGQQLGILAHILVAAAGIGVLITGSPVAFAVVRYTGAGYLIFIGLRQYFSSPADAAVSAPVESPGPPRSAGDAESTLVTGSVQVLTRVETHAPETRPTLPDTTKPATVPTAAQLVRRGFWVNLLNPKAVVFFLAIMPQFIAADRPVVPQYLIIALTMTVIDMTVMIFVFAAAAERFRRYTGSTRGQLVSNRIFGSLFVLIAAVMLLIN